jgi:hypothetical protein
MTNEWFYAKAGKREGPVSIEDLKRLVQQGQLQPTDNVWKQGTPAWVSASSVDGLFEAEPPPLPPSPPTKATNQNSLHKPEDLAGWLQWLDHHKIVISVVTFVVGMSLSFLSSVVTTKDAPKVLFFLIGILPAGVFGTIWAINRQKREMLHGLWEPISGDGVYFQFTKDGALVRGDGVATRYRWLANDKIELYTDDASPKVEIEVLSLSKMELVVRANGQGGHFKKGVTVTEQASREAWAKAGAIAGGAAMLALGGLAVLGGMAAGVATAGSSSSSGDASDGSKSQQPKLERCTYCGGTGIDMYNRSCGACAGKGIKW